jgi:hypothetical protein
MKKLISLLGAGILFFGSATAQEVKPETDMFKYIPYGSDIAMYDEDNDGIFDVFWHDKNHDEEVQDDELFFDVTKDNIPDMDYPTFQEYKKSQEQKSEESTSEDMYRL